MHAYKDTGAVQYVCPGLPVDGFSGFDRPIVGGAKEY